MLSRRWLLIMAVAFVGLVLVTDLGVFPIAVAVLAAAVFLRIGFGFLGGMSQPVPEPPPAGELRKVKIEFRCSICGAELVMKIANDEMPDPPRHCLEDMDLVTPVFE